MNTSGIDRVRSGLTLGVGLALLSAAPLAASDEDSVLRPEAEATVGVRFYDIEDQDNDFLAGFWDQYRHTRKKNDNPPFFFDVLHLDAGLARPDDTYLIRLESFSPNATNDRVEVDGRYRGLQLDLDYRRYRSEELRVYPRGTYQNETPPGAPTYATQFNPDASLSQIENENRRFWLRRTGVDGELRVRPDGFGLAIPILAQASVRSGFEQRKGYRQDLFMLDAAEDFFSAPTARFRGFRRRTDQEVTNVGGNIVLHVVDLGQANWTQEFDVGFESFREKANPVTFADVAAGDPSILPFGNSGLRSFNFTPNTDRINAFSRSNLELGPVGVTASGFFSHLRQTNKAPLQRSLGIDKQEVLTWSAHLGLDVPIGERAQLNAFAKVSERRNDLDENDFQTAPISAILRRRTEVDAEVELAARPAAGAQVATGYRYEWIGRNLRRSSSTTSSSLALVEDHSERHAVYVRGRAHLLRRIHVAGELGWEYAPERDYPTDPTYVVYFDGRASYTLPRPWPITLSMNGSVRDGHGNGRVLDAPGTEARKDLDRRQWDYTASVAMVPSPRTSVSLSFTHQRDRQDFPFVRFDVPFTSGVVEFFPNPDRIRYHSDVKSVTLNASMKLTDSLEIRHFESFNWVKASFGDRNNSSKVLETVNEIDQSIVSLGFGLGWQAMPGLELDFGYRLDDFDDNEDRGPFDTDDLRHTFTLGATVGLDLFTSSTSN